MVKLYLLFHDRVLLPLQFNFVEFLEFFLLTFLLFSFLLFHEKLMFGLLFPFCHLNFLPFLSLFQNPENNNVKYVFCRISIPKKMHQLMIIVRMILRRFSFKHYIKEIKFSFTKVLVEYNRATAPHSLLLKFNLFLLIPPLFFSLYGFDLKQRQFELHSNKKFLDDKILFQYLQFALQSIPEGAAVTYTVPPVSRSHSCQNHSIFSLHPWSLKDLFSSEVSIRSPSELCRSRPSSCLPSS